MSVKKIVALNGSPHKQGKTASLIDEVIKVAREQGAEVKSYHLNGMKIKGCQGCYSCRVKGRCVLQDDMQVLYDEIESADSIILGTPVYMWQMSAQLKLAVDRFMPFLGAGYRTNLAPGKKVLIAVTQNRPDTSMFYHYFEHMGKNLVFLGFSEYKILIFAGADKLENLQKQTEVMAEARQIGGWLSGI
ncbi:iron-sulfur flavoprotein [Oxobacter pfennigii]|uniref:Iron-sulfur flavoprotein n=1 Tax=Oxobacter pfennigii TaxID=36849 RepID=A0A0P8YCJ9_9CLOT|nr:flavodoxin family protein [Oxobacter pfennigii]KPU44889.1 iron-sulfur flavoprotein [Oxobacter pfennigii]